MRKIDIYFDDASILKITKWRQIRYNHENQPKIENREKLSNWDEILTQIVKCPKNHKKSIFTIISGHFVGQHVGTVCGPLNEKEGMDLTKII